ncbi:MAG: glutathione S-transferase family protein [Deltaproteobacteria bacterium]
MKIKLYGPRMGSSLRTHWVAAEVGIDYEWAPVDFSKAENRSDWFLKINPMGQVPALTCGELNLSESLAICSYLIDVAHSDLGGASAEARASAWQWSLWASLNLQPHLTTLASPAWTQQPLAPDAEAAAKAGAAKYLTLLETHLASRPFVAGEVFSVGDINVACVLGYAAFSKYDLSAYSAINAWQAKVTARPAYNKARG